MSRSKTVPQCRAVVRVQLAKTQKRWTRVVLSYFSLALPAATHEILNALTESSCQ